MTNVKDIPHADENFLEHHGVKGMKWGVRRDRSSGGTSGSSSGGTSGGNTKVTMRPDGKADWTIHDPKSGKTVKVTTSHGGPGAKEAAHTVAAEHIKKALDARKAEAEKNDPRKMTDAELRDAVQRIRMEREYAQLTAGKKSTTARASSTVTSIIAKGLQLGAQEAVKNVSGKLIQEALTTAIKSSTKVKK